VAVDPDSAGVTGASAARGRVVVVGLGPGDPRLVTVGALEAIEAASTRFVRTTRHPSCFLVSPARSFDDVYASAPTLDAVYREVVEEHVAAAAAHGEVLYAVPGSPLVAERTVELLVDDPRVEVKIVPSLSFLDLAWARLGVDPVDRGVRLVDGHRFHIEAAGNRGPFLVGQCDSRLVLSNMKLAVEEGPRVTVLQRLGLEDESVSQVDWADLDRGFEPDHLTCVWIPVLEAPVAAEIVRLVELVRILRSQCPWDRRQTHRSLTRHLIEETYEVLEAIDELDRPDGYAHLEEELGDLLFQVAFHANLAAEQGQFELSDVARGIHDKLVERHPHVFADPGGGVPDWEDMKRLEKGRTGALEGVPGALPSLLYAYKLQSRAASVGFDWPDATGARVKISEELEELDAALEAHGAGSRRSEDELGDVLFSVVNLARHLGFDPETVLREAAAKFRGRFETMEALAAERGEPLSDELWEQAKLSHPPQPGR
jgi:tetrapyrrole methylase family protein/MazG family protein